MAGIGRTRAPFLSPIPARTPVFLPLSQLRSLAARTCPALSLEAAAGRCRARPRRGEISPRLRTAAPPPATHSVPKTLLPSARLPRPAAADPGAAFGCRPGPGAPSSFPPPEAGAPVLRSSRKTRSYFKACYWQRIQKLAMYCWGVRARQLSRDFNSVAFKFW